MRWFVEPCEGVDKMDWAPYDLYDLGWLGVGEDAEPGIVEVRASPPGGGGGGGGGEGCWGSEGRSPDAIYPKLGIIINSYICGLGGTDEASLAGVMDVGAAERVDGA